jgi:hypothetical protein
MSEYVSTADHHVYILMGGWVGGIPDYELWKDGQLVDGGPGKKLWGIMQRMNRKYPTNDWKRKEERNRSKGGDDVFIFERKQK